MALFSLLCRYDEAPDQAYALIHLTKEMPSLIGRELEKTCTGNRRSAALVENEGNGVNSFLEARIIAGKAMAAWAASLDEWYEGGGKENLRLIVEKAFALASKL